MLRSMLIESQRRRVNILAANVPDFITSALKSCKHDFNKAVHSTTRTSPRSFVYNRDMMLPIQCFTSWEAVRFFKMKTSLRNLFHENSRRRHFDWQPCLKVLVSSELNKNKLQAKASGPYEIDKVHTNGTVTLKKGNLRIKMNIPRLKFIVNNNFHVHLSPGGDECNKHALALLLPRDRMNFNSLRSHILHQPTYLCNRTLNR